MGQSRTEYLGPKLGVQESHEKNEENHNLRFMDFSASARQYVSRLTVSRRPLPVSRVGSGRGALSAQASSATTRPRSTARICTARQVVSASTSLSVPLTARGSFASAAQVPALSVVRGAVQTARRHRHLARQACGRELHGRDELYEFLQRSHAHRTSPRRPRSSRLRESRQTSDQREAPEIPARLLKPTTSTRVQVTPAYRERNTRIPHPQSPDRSQDPPSGSCPSHTSFAHFTAVRRHQEQDRAASPSR